MEYIIPAMWISIGWLLRDGFIWLDNKYGFKGKDIWPTYKEFNDALDTTKDVKK